MLQLATIDNAHVPPTLPFAEFGLPLVEALLGRVVGAGRDKYKGRLSALLVFERLGPLAEVGVRPSAAMAAGGLFGRVAPTWR